MVDSGFASRAAALPSGAGPSSRALMRGLAALAVLLALGSAAGFLWREHQQELRSATRLSVQRVAVLADDLQTSLTVAQVMLARLQARLDALPDHADAGELLRQSQIDQAPLLASLPLPVSLVAIGPDGVPTAPSPLPAGSVLPLPEGTGGPAAPPVGPTGHRVLPLLRRAATLRHGVAAWALVFDLGALRKHFDSLREAGSSAAALFSLESDGSTLLLARAPYDERQLGRRDRGPLATALALAPQGTVNATSPVDDRRHLMTYRRLPGNAQQLVVVDDLDVDAVLGPWHALLPWKLAATLLLVAALLTGARRLDRALAAQTLQQQALQRSEHRFRSLADNLPDVVVRLDAEGRHLYANAAVSRASGLAPEAFIGKTNRELGMPPANVSAWLTTLHKVFESGQRERLEFAYPGPDGARHWESVVALEPAPAGAPATALVISRDISERKAAEQALADSEQRLRLALDAANQGLYDLDLRSGNAVVSPEYARMLGWDPADFHETLHSWRERLHPDDLDPVSRAFDDCLSGRRSDYRVEFRQRTRDGSWKWMLSIGRVMQHDADGHPLRMLGTHTDITARKLDETALRASELRFRLAAASGQVWEWDFGSGSIAPPSEFFTMLGWPAPDAGQIATAFESLLDAQDLAAMKQTLALHLKRQAPYHVQFRARDAQGQLRWFDTQGQAIWDQDGKATFMAGTVFEITQRRQAEEQVQRLAADLEQRVIERTAQLARSEARYRTIFETVPIAIGEEDWSEVQALLRELRAQGVSDAAGHFAAHPDFVRRCLRAVVVRRRNRKLLALHDARDQSADDQTLEVFFPGDDDLAQFRGELEAVWTGERLLTARRSLPSMTGRPLNLMLTMSLPTLDDGDGTALTCLLDISEVDRLNAELERSMRRLREVNQELETFTYSVSHDLKAPLRGIDGYSRLLLADHRDRLDEEGREFLGHIRQATVHMGLLIDDLLNYSRLERRDQTLQRLSLAGSVDAVLGSLRPNLDATAVLALKVDADLFVQADAQGLTMVLRNLIDNAIKFSRGSSPARIDISATRSQGGVQLSVQDNGIGFDMKFHDRIFSIFQRLQRAEDYPGTGVGLAIVRKAIDRMNGKVWAHSQPGQGATFTLQLPEAS